MHKFACNIFNKPQEVISGPSFGSLSAVNCKYCVKLFIRHEGSTQHNDFKTIVTIQNQLALS